MSIPTFRRATRDDLTAIVALLADDPLGKSREDSRLPLDSGYLSAFTAMDSDPNQFPLVVEQHGIVVGYLQLSFIPGLSHKGRWRGQIESVRVATHMRSAGLGKDMLKWAIGRCRARGCGIVQLTTDKERPDALRFYESLGFEASHEGLKLRI